MKRLLALIIIIFTINTAFSQETVSVKPYNKRLVTTGNGLKSHTTWAVFPSKDKDIRKILLKLTLATPEEDYMSCAHWDYLDRLILIQNGGEKGGKLNYEIARMLTPYGGRYHKGWGFTWEVDITDFAHVLRDSVLLDYTHSGWESSTDRGWALTTEFVITYGKPSSEVTAIHKVYDDTYKYGYEDNPIEEHLKPYHFTISKKSNYIRSVIFQTGHGSDSLGNSEFSAKWRKLFWNGSEVSHKVLWTEGGDNPLYPQAGTWLLDRANWIPGMLIDPDVCNIMVKGGKKAIFDLDMEPYIMRNNPSAEQKITAYLIEYKTDKKSNDVELFDIVVPSDKDIHSRKNPSTSHPVIVVKNHSTKEISSLLIEYNDTKELWEGVIEPFEKIEIELKGFVDNTNTKFMASIVEVNGKKDSYPSDNTMESIFTPAPIHKGDIVINMTTNKMSDTENSLVIYNSVTGEKVVDYPYGSLKSEESYKIEKSLPNGNYIFELTDKGGDGLDFWFKKNAGTGSCWIGSGEGGLIESFNPDFGNSVRYCFRVDKSLEEENHKKEPVIQVVSREVNVPSIYFRANSQSDPITLKIYNYVGKEICSATITSKDNGITIDMTKQTPGLYFVKLTQNGYEGVKYFYISKTED